MVSSSLRAGWATTSPYGLVVQVQQRLGYFVYLDSHCSPFNRGRRLAIAISVSLTLCLFLFFFSWLAEILFALSWLVTANTFAPQTLFESQLPTCLVGLSWLGISDMPLNREFAYPTEKSTS